MPSHEPEQSEVVPIPGQENEAERRRVRQSNDQDQQAEARGESAPHNRGYDEAADAGTAVPADPVDEE